MKTLYIVRHAQAEEHYLYQRDFDRELTSKGIRKAVQVGKQLAAEGNIPEVIIASSAVRTRQTAALLAENLGIGESAIMLEEDLYNASPRTLLHVVCHISDNFRKVMLVGHNPGVSYLAEWLTGSRDINSMATCSVAHVVLNLTHWAATEQNCGTLLQYRDFD
jgi:phosphohistidine phosphatase